MTTRRVGTILGLLCAAFLLFDASLKIFKLRPAVEGTVRLGYTESVLVPLGFVLLIATILAVLPPTRVFGAIVLTGYLGGATATHVRAGEPWFFPIVFGVLVWLSIWLTDERFRRLLWTPSRSLTVATHEKARSMTHVAGDLA